MKTTRSQSPEWGDKADRTVYASLLWKVISH